jgi:hypothetical protein
MFSERKPHEATPSGDDRQYRLDRGCVVRDRTAIAVSIRVGAVGVPGLAVDRRGKWNVRRFRP